jgi:hypothetical protein
LINYKSILLLFAVGLIIAGLIFWMTKEKKVVTGNKIKKNITGELEKKSNYYDQQNPLTKTEDCLFRNECISFYNIINDEMKTFLARRFNMSLEDLNSKRLAIVMDKDGIPNEIILQTQELIKEIERQLYTPYERNDELSQMYTQAQNIVQILINKTIS